jgi:hypothetical protein
MTRRPRSKKKARPSAKMVRRPAQRVTRRRTTKRDPLDELVAAGAQALGLKIEASWVAEVRDHLDVILRHGMSVSEFGLPDDTEPGPVFRV